MIASNDNDRKKERRIEIDCWDDGCQPCLVTMFDPAVQPEPTISEIFDELGDARIAAAHYSRVHGPARIYDMTGCAS